jgi:uncharacterized Zn finger protein
MELRCDSCNGDKWKMTIYEMKVFGQNSIYTAVKCETCGMVYPLTQLAKNQPKDTVIGMLKSE